LKYKVIRKLFDPFEKKMKLPGEIIEIKDEDLISYGNRIEKLTKDKIKYAVVDVKNEETRTKKVK